MPFLPFRISVVAGTSSSADATEPSQAEQTPYQDEQRRRHVRIKNRRKVYLDRHPDYFSPALELADPLLYDRWIRRFQSPAEREAEGRKKGYSGILEADLMRSEAKLAALAQPSSASVTYSRGPNGEIYPEDPQDIPVNKEEGMTLWRQEMTQRFLKGADDDFDYKVVDENEEWDDRVQEEREVAEHYFGDEEPSWIMDDEDQEGESGRETSKHPSLKGQTGIQDY